MYHLFFLNKKSLRGRTDKCRDDIQHICVDNGLRYEIIITDNIFDLKDSVIKYESHKDAVYYAVGGDGTFQVLANLVNLENTIIQYLPYGSGNNAYITFYNQDFDLKRDILSTDTFKADLGRANGEYFVTMFGLALDSQTGNNLAKFKWLPLSGKGKYYASIIYTLLFNSKPVKVKMTVDGVAEEKASSYISVTNGQTVGGKTPISPLSCPFDGKLNLVMSSDIGRLRAIKMFSSVKITGEHLKDPCVSHYAFEELTFESVEKLLYQIDGEIRHSSLINIIVCRDAITLKGKKRD